MLSIVALLWLGACGDDGTTVRDGGSSRDSGSVRRDAAGLDAAGRDAAGADAAGADAAGRDAGEPGMVRLPPANGGLDYQLGGAYPPPAGVAIVSRDRTAAIAPGIYNICYVNGFQSQPDEDDFWLETHPDLVLRDESGDPVIDPDWDEMILDVRTDATRTALAAIVGEWIEGCATSGFDAVEIDNLDTYSRSGGRITQDHAVAFMRMLSDVAHANGLAIAQKNSTEVLSRRDDMATDFAVAEECNRYDECGDYTGEYGDAVLVIEYRRGDFDTGCGAFPNLSIVLRDLNLVTPGDSGYVYDGC